MNMLRKIIFDQARENWLAYRAARMDQPGERALAELLLNELYLMNTENLTGNGPQASVAPVAQPGPKPAGPAAQARSDSPAAEQMAGAVPEISRATMAGEVRGAAPLIFPGAAA